MLATFISAITIALPLMIVQCIPLDSTEAKDVRDVESGTLKAIPTYQQGIVNIKGFSIDTPDGLLPDEPPKQDGINENSDSSIEDQYQMDSSEGEEDSAESEAVSSETSTSTPTRTPSVSPFPLPTPMPPPVKLSPSPSPSTSGIAYPNALMSCRCIQAGSRCTTDLASESMVCEPGKHAKFQKPICRWSCCTICLIHSQATPCLGGQILRTCRNEYFRANTTSSIF